MKFIYIIYRLTFPNNKVYIGQTCQRFISYMDRYERNSKNKNYKGYNILLYKAIRKYKWNNIKKEILFDNISKGFVDELETYLIFKYNSTNRKFGYNILEVGESRKGFKHSEESKEKMRKSHLGKSLSTEIKLKISKKLSGKNHPLYKKHHSKETKEKMRKSHIGKKNSVESIEKMRKSHIGKTGYWKGKKLSEETKKKKSNSMKLYYKLLND